MDAGQHIMEYDKFILTATLSTSSTPLSYYGLNIPGTINPWYISTPYSFIQKVSRLVITNTGTSTATVTISAVSTSTSNPTLTLLTVSLAAGDTKTFESNEIELDLRYSYYLTATISTGSGYIQAIASFVPG